MDAHTWIYIFAIIAYLYFLTKVYDSYKNLSIKKIKIHPPELGNIKDKERWILEMRTVSQEFSKHKKGSLLLFFLIPLVEITAHLIIGKYEINSQLLSAIFLVLFFICLLVVLFVYKGRRSNKIEKKYTWKSGVFM